MLSDVVTTYQKTAFAAGFCQITEVTTATVFRLQRVLVDINGKPRWMKGNQRPLPWPADIAVTYVCEKQKGCEDIYAKIA